ncbi:signal peptide peptidase SppA [Spirulina major]|uniref:signal peptide peptidase SppA n=1 Tax=Spirulina major TaxID=270636 RepID=UPI000932E39B|nr:signal peptide peptidase SppA [Spirulina major]
MWKFLRDVSASAIGTITAVVFLVLLGTGAGLVVVVALLATTEDVEEPTVRDRSILVLDLSTPIRDSQLLDEFTEAIAVESNVITLRQAKIALAEAAQDDRIVGLLIDGSGGEAGMGFATAQALRPALVEFQESGKRVMAYDVDWSEGDYYLGSVADTVVINPMGELEFNGLGAEQTFLTGALEKFGVGVQVVRAGNYKSAVEPFIETEFSAASREQLTALLGDLWQEFLTAVGRDRNQTPQALQAIAATQGFLLPTAAVQAELIDQVAYFDEVAAELRTLTEQEEEPKQQFRQVTLSNYRNEIEDAIAGDYAENKIAILYAAGEIVYGEGEVEQIGSDRLIRQIRDLRRDEDVQAIVLRINSPGGSATASDLILRELQLTREQKPIIVSMGNVAASGGYWIALESDRIFAESTTITGSIGVFGLLPNLEGITTENGITWDSVKTAPLADIDTLARPKTEAELATIQQFVDQIYNLFLDKVARSRDLPRSEVAAIAQGRVWSGSDAAANGLVDQIGGLEDAIAYAAETADLGDNWQIEEYQNELTFEEFLFRTFSIQDTTPLTQEWVKLQTQLQHLTRFSDPRHLYSIAPTLTIR